MNCRVCNSANTVPVFSLGNMPLANSLLDSPDQSYKTYPLELILCRDCTLVQLSKTVPPEEMFVDYNYLTSYSAPMLAHAKQLVERVLASHSLTNRSLVVEIGSNDGYLLQYYDHIPTLGIDPSDRAADAAMEKGVPTVRGFFNAKLGQEMRGQADVIHANNVLAHVPDLNDFVLGLSRMLKDDGTIIIEVPYLCRMIDHTAFDQIYHEHVYQFSVTALVQLFLRHGLYLADVEEIPVHGGSLRLWINKRGVSGRRTQAFLSNEPGIDSEAYYRAFVDRVEECKLATRRLLEGHKVAGFGAAAKATIFLNACGIHYPDILRIADDSPEKHGKYIPGTGIQVVPIDKWLARESDRTLILCWNFADEILHRYHAAYPGELLTWYTPAHV